MAVMAMFPLGMVLLPGGVLPLHVFEPRYRQMIVDLLERDEPPEFGQVLITRGTETGGGDERSGVGTVAQIVAVDALDESRYALVTVGTRRIVVRAWLPDNPYPVADVEEWPDELPAQPGLTTTVQATHARVLEVLALAAEVGDVSSEFSDVELSDDPLIATYGLTAMAPIGTADRHRLLSAPGPQRRLEILAVVLDDVEAMLRFRLS